MDGYELLIIDSSSTDKTVEVAKKYTEKIIIIPQSQFDHGETRTKAVQLAKGELIIFFTQDVLPQDDNTIANIIKVFEDKRLGAAYGRQVNYDNTNLFGVHLREFNYRKTSSIKSRSDIPYCGLKTAFLSNSFTCYRKSALESIGFLESNLIFGEDMHAGAKMILNGYKIAYVAEAKVYHSHNYTIWQEFKRYFDMGVFHRSESWLIETFGKPEGEGIKFVRSGVKYLEMHGAWYLIPEFFMRVAMNYLGYKLGQNYDKLPPKIRRRISLHDKWWNRLNKQFYSYDR